MAARPARLWLLALSGPGIWFGCFVGSYAFAADSCSPLGRGLLMLALALGVLGCGIGALIGARWTRQLRLAESNQHFLALAGTGLHAFCALLLLAQLLPVLMRVRCV
jgi:hypothetical protein